MVHYTTAVVPGDRRETRDPFRNLYRKSSGMDPGSSLRFARDDRAGEWEIRP
jgi:hypothetical protein